MLFSKRRLIDKELEKFKYKSLDLFFQDLALKGEVLLLVSTFEDIVLQMLCPFIACKEKIGRVISSLDWESFRNYTHPFTPKWTVKW